MTLSAGGVRVIEAANRDPLTVVHITDTHLLEDADARLLGVPTYESLRRVVSDIRDRIRGIDLVIASGDIAQDGHRQSYRHFHELLTQLEAPVVCVPGNHDDPAAMHEALVTSPIDINRSVRLGDWLIVMLNSQAPGQEYGRLEQSELHRLASELQAQPECPALVVLHHPPVVIGSAWMDAMGLREPDTLFDVLAPNPGVRAVVWGHVHQVFDARRGVLRLLSTPATCFQFKPQRADCVLDTRPPGYRVLTLRGSALETEVVWVANAWVEPNQSGDC